MQAIWNGKVVAESDDTIVIEGNHYFPPDSVDRAFFADSDLTTDCVWKGTAHYYNLIEGDDKDSNAAWYYPEPLPGSLKRVKKDFSKYVAFYPNLVEVK